MLLPSAVESSVLASLSSSTRSAADRRRLAPSPRRPVERPSCELLRSVVAVAFLLSFEFRLCLQTVKWLSPGRVLRRSQRSSAGSAATKITTSGTSCMAVSHSRDDASIVTDQCRAGREGEEEGEQRESEQRSAPHAEQVDHALDRIALTLVVQPRAPTHRPSAQERSAT